MSDISLQVVDIGKCYTTYKSNLARFASWFGVPVQRTSEYWAARNISFSVNRGEAVALIGQNGAGKSTILKLITGTIRPSTGSIHLVGRVGAILELGLGFNPELTGRQNAYLAGGLMGMGGDELAAFMPEIESFAEIGEFFDRPLRVYSSGMHARLAFAVATARRPEILIVDEILSVGDSYFQHKSFARIRQFKELGTSILLVTHGMGDVREFCDRVILIDHGRILKAGLPDEVVDYYNALVTDRENARGSIEQKRQDGGWLVTRAGTKDVELKWLRITDAASGEEVSAIRVGQRIAVLSESIVRRPAKRLVMGHLLRDRGGHVVWGTNTWHTKQVLTDLLPGQTVQFRFEFNCNLGPGSYSLTYNLVSTETRMVDDYDSVDNYVVFDVINVDHCVFAGTTWLDARISLSVT